MKKLKVMTLSKIAIEQREMKQLRGGCDYVCGCACAYINAGGSSVVSNKKANFKYGFHSYGANGECPYGWGIYATFPDDFEYILP